VFSHDFDPLRVLEDLANNQAQIGEELQRQARELKLLHQHMNQQAQTIEHLIAAIDHNTKLTKELMQWQNHK